MEQKKTKFTVEEIVEILLREEKNETIEGKLLKPRLIRKLYRQLGDPSKKDFEKEMEPAGTYWTKENGYTTDIEIMTERHMKYCNNQATDWQISYPSATKKSIVEKYEEKGWSCSVGPYVVSCIKFVRHPRYENIWVRFRSTRDHNKYEYVIEKEENE